ncbi:MAG: segregation/condensation protein A [Oscillospiraceae bacterium]
MQQLSFKIEEFEGPLDILLTLISKNKMSIIDIEILVIINQYLDIINSAQDSDLDIASDFIDMAARLIYLKSVYLLPKDDEGEKLKAELQGQLIEYSQAKIAAQMFKNRFVGDRIFVRNMVEVQEDMTYDIVHPISALTQAYSQLSDRNLKRSAPVSQRFETIVNAPVVSVSAKIYSVLKGMMKSSTSNLKSAFETVKSKSEAVAIFLAVLELLRAHRISIQDNGDMSLNRKENR